MEFLIAAAIWLAAILFAIWRDSSRPEDEYEINSMEDDEFDEVEE